MRIIPLILVIILSVSCSLSPLHGNYTGRSYGSGKMNIELGNVAANYYSRLGYGVSKNLDVGYLFEFGGFATSGLYLRYSFLNNETGPAWGIETGFGGTDNSSYMYLGPNFSLRFSEAFEVFLSARYTNLEVDRDGDDYELGTNIGGIIYNDYDLNFIHAATGFNIWFSNSVGLNMYMVYAIGENVEVEDAPFGFSFIFKI